MSDDEDDLHPALPYPMTQRMFRYPEAFVTMPEYSAHRGQVVDVIRPLRRDEYDFQGDAMFLIRAADGWKGHAYNSELREHPPERNKETRP